jgi:hypothetical protein
VCLEVEFFRVSSGTSGLVYGLAVRVSGYRPRGLGLIPALPDFLRSSESGTGCTQPREYNCGTT